MLIYYVFRMAALLVPLVPLRLGYFVLTLIAELSCTFRPQACRIVEANLRRVLGPDADERTVKATARRVFHNGARNYFDLFRVRRLDLEQVRNIVTVEGWDNLEQARRPGKGAILAAAHLGNLDIVAQAAAANSLLVTIPVEHLSPQKLFDLVIGIRQTKGVSFVPVDGGALKAIYRALGRNEVVAIASDRDVLKNGVEVTFFGETTTVPNAPAILALRTGAAILPTCSLRHPDGTYSVRMEPALDVRYTGDLRQDVRYNTQQIVHALERFIRENPEQWVVFEPVWRR